MNWEKSRALTPLKREFLSRFFAEERQFYLTGGSALGIFYLEHRLSYDLDFFTDAAIDWHRLENGLIKIAEEMGAKVEALPDYLLEPVELDEFRAYLEALQTKMALLAFPESPA